MKVKIATAKQMLADVYLAKGVAEEDVDWLVELSLEQELTGNYFSGFDDGSGEGIYGGFDKSFREQYEVDRPAVKLINGHGKSSKLIMKNVFPKAITWAKEQGQVFIGFKNCGYHGALGTIARKFAEHDLLCVYAANGGPLTVPPHGGTKGLFGTNPIAYGIPTNGMPIVFDAATSERPYGSIGRAKQHHTALQSDTYYADDGSFTTDPDRATAIISFGGHKGSAINLLLDVLTGALVGAGSGSFVTGDSDIGAYLQLIDPVAFGSLDDFKKQTDRLVEDIDHNPPAKGFSKVRVPGHRGLQLRKDQLTDGSITVADDAWQRFTALHEKLVAEA